MKLFCGRITVLSKMKKKEESVKTVKTVSPAPAGGSQKEVNGFLLVFTVVGDKKSNQKLELEMLE